MWRLARSLAASLGWLFLTSMMLPDPPAPEATPLETAAPAVPAIRLPPPPPTVGEVLDDGVLIVISKASQRMFVFKDGALWDSSPVSTGRRGHTTPSGVFPILQKKVRHRSNKYSNAPMPYMQRLTWDGIAIHAGRLPGYAASHGCIRLPWGFARSLYALTRASSTAVVIDNSPLRSGADAHRLALNVAPQRSSDVRLARVGTIPPLAVVPPTNVVTPPPAPAPGSQTIQLAAASSPGEAEAHWQRLLLRQPALATMRRQVIPATVGSRLVYRLRVAAPGAHAFCSALKTSGIDCFRVV